MKVKSNQTKNLDIFITFQNTFLDNNTLDFFKKFSKDTDLYFSL